MQVDKGAIKFILSGANVMCPGLTSPGARMTHVESETVVVSFVMASLYTCLLHVNFGKQRDMLRCQLSFTSSTK